MQTDHAGNKTQRQKTRISFDKLSWGTLRKYQYYFRVKGGDEGDSEGKRDKKAVVEAVKSHFEHMKIDYTKVVTRFLRIKKDEKSDLYNLRKVPRPRYQPNFDSAFASDSLFGCR